MRRRKRRPEEQPKRPARTLGPLLGIRIGNVPMMLEIRHSGSPREHISKEILPASVHRSKKGPNNHQLKAMSQCGIGRASALLVSMEAYPMLPPITSSDES